ncbi:unnamed protein product [Closterium sp. Naga37s-1]|nr:unnamed protein product [Closterium sp. Naga37s-1]
MQVSSVNIPSHPSQPLSSSFLNLSPKQLPCHQEYLCDRRCQRGRPCGRHLCKRRCCAGDCPPCPERQLCNGVASLATAPLAPSNMFLRRLPSFFLSSSAPALSPALSPPLPSCSGPCAPCHSTFLIACFFARCLLLLSCPRLPHPPSLPSQRSLCPVEQRSSSALPDATCAAPYSRTLVPLSPHMLARSLPFSPPCLSGALWSREAAAPSQMPHALPCAAHMSPWGQLQGPALLAASPVASPTTARHAIITRIAFPPCLSPLYNHSRIAVTTGRVPLAASPAGSPLTAATPARSGWFLRCHNPRPPPNPPFSLEPPKKKKKGKKEGEEEEKDDSMLIPCHNPRPPPNPPFSLEPPKKKKKGKKEGEEEEEDDSMLIPCHNPRPPPNPPFSLEPPKKKKKGKKEGEEEEEDDSMLIPCHNPRPPPNPPFSLEPPKKKKNGKKEGEEEEEEDNIMPIFLPLIFTPLPTTRCHGPRPPPNLPFSLEPPKKKKKGKKEGEEEEGQGKPGSPCPSCVVPVVRECRGRHQGQECEVGASKAVCSLALTTLPSRASYRVVMPIFVLPCSHDPAFSCELPCGNPLACGNHACQLACHVITRPRTVDGQRVLVAKGGEEGGEEEEEEGGVREVEEGGEEGKSLPRDTCYPCKRACQKVGPSYLSSLLHLPPPLLLPHYTCYSCKPPCQKGPSMRASLPGAVPSGQLPAVQKPSEKAVLLRHHDPCDRVRPMGCRHGGRENQNGVLHGALPQVTVRCACLRLKKEWLCSQVQSETAKAAANGASKPTSSADSNSGGSVGGGGGGRLRESMVGVGLIPCDDECRRIQEEEWKRREAEEKREAERKAAAAAEAERLRLEVEAAVSVDGVRLVFGFIPPAVSRWVIIVTLFCLLLVLSAGGGGFKALLSHTPSPLSHSFPTRAPQSPIVSGSSLLLCVAGLSSSPSFASSSCSLLGGGGGGEGELKTLLSHTPFPFSRSLPTQHPRPSITHHPGFIPPAVRRWAVSIILLCFLLLLLFAAEWASAHFSHSPPFPLFLPLSLTHSQHPHPSVAHHQAFIPPAVKRWAVIMTHLCFLLLLLLLAIGVHLKALPAFIASPFFHSQCAAVGRHRHSPWPTPAAAARYRGAPQGTSSIHCFSFLSLPVRGGGPSSSLSLAYSCCCCSLSGCTSRHFQHSLLLLSFTPSARRWAVIVTLLGLLLLLLLAIGGFISPAVRRWAVIITLLCLLLVLLIAAGVGFKAQGVCINLSPPFLSLIPTQQPQPPLHLPIIRGSSRPLCVAGPSSSLSSASSSCCSLLGEGGSRHFSLTHLPSPSLAHSQPNPRSICPSSGVHPTRCASLGRHHHSPLPPPPAADAAGMGLKAQGASIPSIFHHLPPLSPTFFPPYIAHRQGFIPPAVRRWAVIITLLCLLLVLLIAAGVGLKALSDWMNERDRLRPRKSFRY